jgi:uncharacterized protein (DUF302 family)
MQYRSATEGGVMGQSIDSIVEHPSSLTHAQTVAQLEAAIGKAGLTVFARIDHAENARAVGLTMPPAIVLIYGSPLGGTPLMLASAQLALDLPLRVLVREAADGQVLVAYHPAAAMLRAAGIPEDLATRLEPAQRLLLAAIAP